MKLYFIQSEKAERWVVSNSANNARSLALKDGVGGHKIDRRVFRIHDGSILETCLRCGQTLPLSLFPKRSGGGYQSYCRECKKQIDREYRIRKKKEA